MITRPLMNGGTVARMPVGRLVSGVACSARGLRRLSPELLPALSGEVGRLSLALYLKSINWREKTGSKNSCNKSLLFGSHLS
jgi:hypothetical protein